MTDFSKFASLKGEFEAEGLTREDVAVEVIYAARQGIDYLVKIGGCEAKSDVDYLSRIGVSSLVAPMIESPFAMSKYMGLVEGKHFHHVGVTIETFIAVDNIEAILDAGVHLNNATVGRSDLTASFKGTGVDSPETIEKVKIVARAAKKRGLEVTMGGGVNAKTRELLRTDKELAELLDTVETRKVIMPISSFIQDGVLEAAIQVELDLLDLHGAALAPKVKASADRAAQIRSRL